MDVAWVLFDGLQTDPETVRMIRDIQLKNPLGLADQVLLACVNYYFHIRFVYWLIIFCFL